MIPQTGKALLKFSASWCAPCKVLSKTLGGVDIGVPVIEVDVDAHPDLAQQYSVRGIPTCVVVENGEEIKRKVGIMSLAQVRELVA
jgi:thioredoxin 1